MKRLLGILLAVGLGSGCGPGSLGTFINFSLIVPVNVPDTFTISGVGSGVSGSGTYLWDCSTGQANVVIGTTLTAGSIRLQAWDGNGKLVHDNRYEASLLGAVTAFTSSKGHAGTWELKFTFHNALWSGNLTVTADTTPDPDVIDIGGTGSQDSSMLFEPGWTAADVNITVAGMASGTIRIRLWDDTGAKVYDDIFFGIAGGTAKANGVAGDWTVQIDFNSCINAGAIVISQ